MKKVLFAACCILYLQAMAQPAKNVVLITIDGFRPEFYLDSGWHTPHLRSILRNGVYAKGVNSVFPSMTYPSHTTIVTGVWPARHGIYYNNKPAPKDSIYWMASSIQVPTLWDLAREKGLKTASLFWPVSAQAPVDFNIPDIGSLGEKVREAYSLPASLVADLKEYVFHQTTQIDYGTDHNVAAIAAYIIKKDRPDFMNIHFFSVDHFSHMQGRYGELVHTAVHDADSSVGIIIKALQDAGIWNNTVLIVTGDHGFHDIKTKVSPNVWLKEAGLISNLETGDWKARFYAVGGSCYLYLKDKNDDAILTAVQSVLAQRSDEEKKLFRVIDRQEMGRIGGNPEVAFALNAIGTAYFDNNSNGVSVQPGKGGGHGYFPDEQQIQTGFVAAGPGIRKGSIVREMNVRDIAPLVAYMLHLPLTTADGKIPAGILSTNK